MPGTYTANLNLYNPSLAEIGWKANWDTNFNILDTAIGTYLNADGTFKAATAEAIPFSAVGFTSTDIYNALLEVRPGAVSISSHVGAGLLTASENIVFADASVVEFTLILPPAATAKNMLVIKKTDDTMNVVKIEGNNLETIDGQTLYILYSQYMYVAVVSNGNNWFIVANN
jgi:hypothetical protein